MRHTDGREQYWKNLHVRVANSLQLSAVLILNIFAITGYEENLLMVCLHTVFGMGTVTVAIASREMS